MSTKPPADPSMDRAANPVRPATAPAPRKPAMPPKPGGFQRFMLQFLLLVIALGGAFGTGYLVNANEMQGDRNDLLQQQLDAQERILALEKQIAELQERRESGNRVELDLTEVFEPIREAVGRIALVRMGEISREITTELTRLVEDDLPALDDPANATGTVSPDGMSGGSAGRDQGSSAAAAPAGDAVPPPNGRAPDSLQPNSAASDAAEASDPQAVELVGRAEGTATPAATAAAAASDSPPVSESPPAADLGPPASSAEAALEEVSRSGAPDPPAGGAGIEEGSGQQEPTDVAELVRRRAGPAGPAASRP